MALAAAPGDQRMKNILDIDAVGLERTAHINRIKGLLFAQGIRGINVMKGYKTLAPADLVTGDGHPLPKRLGREITREIQRLALVKEQLLEVENELYLAPTPCQATERNSAVVLKAYLEADRGRAGGS